VRGGRVLAGEMKASWRVAKGTGVCVYIYVQDFEVNALSGLVENLGDGWWVILFGCLFLTS
jgi:hypothetical protein